MKAPTDSWPPDTIAKIDRSRMVELAIVNPAVVGDGPAGVLVSVPKGTKTVPLGPYQEVTSKRPSKSVPNCLATPSGGLVTIQYLPHPPGYASQVSQALDRTLRETPKDAVRVIARPYAGFQADGKLEPITAEVMNLKGDRDRRIYGLMSSEVRLSVQAVWPSGKAAAQKEAVEAAEAVIVSIKPDPDAKPIDFFPEAGYEENSPIPPGIEVAMADGMILEAHTPTGTMTVEAGPDRKRSYTWEGATRSVIMDPRMGERWYGSKGLYYPGPGDHWEDHNGITRGVVEEGQQHFMTVDEAMAWLGKRKWMPYVYSNSGLVVGWGKVIERRQLNVEVWQIMIKGRKPTSLPGAQDDKIVIKRQGSKAR